MGQFYTVIHDAICLGPTRGHYVTNSSNVEPFFLIVTWFCFKTQHSWTRAKKGVVNVFKTVRSCTNRAVKEYFSANTQGLFRFRQVGFVYFHAISGSTCNQTFKQNRKIFFNMRNAY